MTEKQQQHPHHQAPPSRRTAHQRLGGKKQPSAVEKNWRTQIMPAAEERDVQNNDDEQSISRDNVHSNTKNNTNTDDVISAAQMAHLRKLRTRRLQHNNDNEKSHPPKIEQQQHAPTANKQRHHHYHHHKRQSPPRRQHKQNRHKAVKEEVNSSRRRQHQTKSGVVEKQVHKKKNGGATANNSKNVLKVDEVIKAARKRYGNANVSGDHNTKGSHINAGGDTVANKEILRSKRNKVRQTKKQQQHEKQNYGDKRNNQQVRRGNYNRTSVEIHDKKDDGSLPLDCCDEVTDNIQQQNGKNIEEKNVSEILPSAPMRRSEQDLETQRRHGIKVQTFHDYNEDEDCENVECNLDCVEMVPDQLYRYHFSNRLTEDDEENRKVYEDDNMNIIDIAVKAVELIESEDSQQEEVETEANALGKNGWHRLMDLLHTPTDATSGDYNTPLDQQTVMNALESSKYAPILSEKDALREEYEKLQREIESLEKDRVALEGLFYDIEAEKLNQSGRDCIYANEEGEESYRLFRQELRKMSNEDLMSIPSMLWIEDVPLESPSLPHQRNPRQMDANFKKLAREHRGTGLVLLTADTECRNALIEHCYYAPYKGEGDNLGVSMGKPTLRVDGVATMIHGGAKYLRFCGIIGETTSSNYDDHKQSKGGTSYFLKFDGGKTYGHGLPSNLMKRLSREMKELKSIQYLSTGSLLHDSPPSQSDGEEERCYYLEFDGGECWWHVPIFQGEPDHDLERIFSEVDIHRVAFGSSISEGIGASASWIVIGKDGSVFYRNIPQGLHDTLTARDMEETHAAPCEVSLGVSGSYFMRFLDGSVDYNLPKFAADVFEKLESQGLLIRNVSLHVDTVDCLMRFQ
ncbi:hypothetical protein ACHAWT_001393 [Skeletonema menzelii]